MLVGKVQILIPVVWGDVVLARTDVVANPSVDRLVNGWLLGSPELMTE